MLYVQEEGRSGAEGKTGAWVWLAGGLHESSGSGSKLGMRESG